MFLHSLLRGRAAFLFTDQTGSVFVFRGQARAPTGRGLWKWSKSAEMGMLRLFTITVLQV